MESIKKHIFYEEDKYGIGNNLNDFDILQYIGGGDKNLYAKVKSKLDNKIYVMKIIINIELEKYKRLEKKLHILRLIEHPNILKYYSSFTDDNNNYYIIMEYAEGGSIKNFIKIHKKLNKQIEEKKLNKIFYQSLSALNYLHEEGFLHRNITTKNIFLTKDNDIKLGGFDYLCKNDDKSEKVIKPLENIVYYLLKNESSFKFDLYSLGLVIYNLRYLNQKQIVFPQKNDYNSRIYNPKDIEEEETRKLNKGKIYPEDLLMNCIITKNFNPDLNEKIINNYRKTLNQYLNTSIESVYFSLLYFFQNQCILMGNSVDNRKINVNKEFCSNGPITQSFKVKDLSLLRKILIENNKSFERYKEKEIPPIELIKYLLKQLHLENNFYKNNYTKVFTLPNDKNNYKNLSEKEKNDKVQLNRASLISDYENLYNQNFNSFISDKNKGLYGTYEIKDYCKNCEDINYYFESFYYITLDLDSVQDETSIIDIFGNNKDEITCYKFCHNCKNMTEHKEIKSIYKFPCRLVILIKNNSQKSIILSQTIREKKYCCVATINLSESKDKYEYSYFKNNQNTKEQIWKHKDDKKDLQNDMNYKNIVALFYLFIGDQ